MNILNVLIGAQVPCTILIFLFEVGRDMFNEVKGRTNYNHNIINRKATIQLTNPKLIIKYLYFV